MNLFFSVVLWHGYVLLPNTFSIPIKNVLILSRQKIWWEGMLGRDTYEGCKANSQCLTGKIISVLHSSCAWQSIELVQLSKNRLNLGEDYIIVWSIEQEYDVIIVIILYCCNTSNFLTDLQPIDTSTTVKLMITVCL